MTIEINEDMPKLLIEDAGDLVNYFELAYHFANHYTPDAKEFLDISDEEFDRLFDQLELFLNKEVDYSSQLN
tara:strand:- start:271 stop:486 length:216 start_codon:yes stop_codon:yes gene_type:complete